MRYKTIIAYLLIVVLIISGCGNVATDGESNLEEQKSIDVIESSEASDIGFIDEDKVLIPDFVGLEDPALLRYVKDNVYKEVVDTLDSDAYYVENVETVYVSKEYLEEVAFNSQSNVFFGYTLEDLDEQFEGVQYAFGLGEDGTTIVYELEDSTESYEEIMRDVVIGSGVILICVTVSVISAGAGAPAISMIFATSAKTGAIMAGSSGIVGGVSSGIITGIQTGNFKEAVSSGARNAANEFKWGAITGVLTGGVQSVSMLKGVASNGLTMNEAARIQKESKYPLDVIKYLNNMKQYNQIKKVKLVPRMVNGKTALVKQNINLEYVGSKGVSNLERIKNGLPPLDSTGIPYELHHIGQKADSTLAVMTRAEHRMGDNYSLWHKLEGASEIDRLGFEKVKKAFWQEYYELVAG